MGKGNSLNVEALEPRLLLAQPTGALTGKIVYTVGGHGITANYPGNGTWQTQRGDNNDLVEDFGNQDQMTFYVNYLFNAGATRLANQIYRVHHAGQVSEVKVNHQRVGKGWVYLGSYYFGKGTSGFVE